MTDIVIKHRSTGAVLFCGEYDSIKLAVEDAVRLGISLNGADLWGIYLSGADLGGANLSGADFKGAKYKDLVITKPPIQILGLRWDVMIIADYIKIGCQEHLITDWASFDDIAIANMDTDALEFWKKNKTKIMAFVEG